MYVAAKGGETAIDNAHALLAEARRGDPAVAEISVAQIREQLSLSVDRVMLEGSVYDPDLAALAIKQARGDLVEAVHLLRAYRTTLPRLCVSLPLETTHMQVERRISAIYKDLPGGQRLGPTFDYTHRLLDFTLAAGGNDAASVSSDQSGAPDNAQSEEPTSPPLRTIPHAASILEREDLIERNHRGESDTEPGDITREPMMLPDVT